MYIEKTIRDYTVEYFDNQLKTNYRQFNTREEANIFIKSIEGFNYILRETTLEDVFYSFTNRRVV